MLDQQEFNELIFKGKDPEPALLIDLAPILSREALESAIKFAVTFIKEQPLRAWVLKALADRLSEIDREGLLRIPLAEVIPYLPQSLLPDVLTAASVSKDMFFQASTLTALVSQLQGAHRSSVLTEALAAARMIGDPYSQGLALARLVPQMPKAQRHVVLMEALLADRTNKEASFWAEALVTLVPQLPKKERRSTLLEALTAWQDDKGTSFWSDALSVLVSLKSPVPAKSLVVWQTNKSTSFWAEALVALIALLPDTQRHSAVAEMLATVRANKDTSFQSRSLAALLPQLPRAERTPALVEALAALRATEDPFLRVECVSALASHMVKTDTLPLLTEALNTTRAIKYAWQRAEAQGMLIRQIAESGYIDMASEMAQSIEWEGTRSSTLIWLAFCTSARPTDKILKAARDIRLEGLRDNTLSFLLWMAMPEHKRKWADFHSVDTHTPFLNRQLESPSTLSTANEHVFTSLLKQWLRSHSNEKRRAQPDNNIAPPSFTTHGTVVFSGERLRQFLTQIDEHDRNALLEEVPNTLKAVMSEGLEPSGSRTQEAHERLDERVVSTGFAPEEQTNAPLDVATPLSCGRHYYFWLEIGAPVPESIEQTFITLAEHFPPDARLTVALFSFKDEIKVFPGADIGELQLQGDNSVLVTHQPVRPSGLSIDSDLLYQRLFFPVQAPDKVGTFHLRCNIYHEQILIQSRLIYARVMQTPKPGDRALRSVIDYTLSHSLDPAQLNLLAPHRLSLMLNSNGNGTHSFRFLGSKNFKSDASFDGQELENLIQQARGALRMAAWGDEAPWQHGKAYRYNGPQDLSKLTTDLVRCAIRGYRIYDSIVNRLAGGPEQVDKLADLMCTPGMVQIALKESPRFIFPVALIYDYAFDTNAYDGLSGYALCPDFIKALNDTVPLEKLGCFKGDCPSRGSDNTICPSGFWGYRHYIGIPLSVRTGRDMPPVVVYQDHPQLVVAVSTDPDLEERPAHEQALRSLRPDLEWNYADTRESTLTLLKESQPHLVYFYCHGGVANNVPFIQVGPNNERGITRDNLRYKKINWNNTRPLVTINGCNTTALEPEVALEFVSAFVENAGASGIIGTEITIFEPLARVFAEECLRRFMQGVPIGEAVRGARLKLLKEGNPLGLAYIPYVIASLRLVEQRTRLLLRQAEDNDLEHI